MQRDDGLCMCIMWPVGQSLTVGVDRRDGLCPPFCSIALSVSPRVT
jgi:hypothetical protein